MLPTQYQQYIHLSRYARWNEQEKRRETWPETVDRYIDFFSSHLAARDPCITAEDARQTGEALTAVRTAILNLDVTPSMRAMMTAGAALGRDHVAGYNCAYLAIDHPRAFDETMYILMCGTGVGFSVERQSVAKLPVVAEEFHATKTTITVSDSRIGWASSFRELVTLLYAGRLPRWDLTRIRPAGARLKTFGGRASGPAPLDSLFHFTVALFKRAAGRKLSSIECHDLVCKVADVVVAGGVRRSALISLSNLSDDRMRGAKNGQWWIDHPSRALANNSAAYTEKPSLEVWLKEWVTLYESRSGERGIYNRVAAKNKAGENGRRDTDHEFGVNPCGEIILRPMGFCNLSEVVVRPDDTLDELMRKVEVAAIIGTFQSTLTDFRYLRSAWKKNAEEERLLGISLTGVMEHPVLSGGPLSLMHIEQGWPNLEVVLDELKQHAIKVNQEWAAVLGVAPSTAVTCIKPSGTVSQLVGCSSGIHPAYSEFYIRTVRSDAKDPLAHYMRDAGVPCEPDVTKPDAVLVFGFPVKSSGAAIKRDDRTAIEQLQTYLVYRKHWCEHNPSMTIYYSDDEFLGVGQWVWDHWDEIGGIAFLPRSDHVYQQAPYQEITKEQYEAAVAAFPVLDWAKLKEYEKEDATTGQHELSCSAGMCEL